jgi:adenosylcobyric acid synthase
MSRAKFLMIQGTASNVGKSLITAALCRIYARHGYKVFPFKSQNMALNSFATPEGLEIGRAQALQAIAAGRVPHVEMNPVLLKPEANTSAQVVFMGKPWNTIKGNNYASMKPLRWDKITSILDQAARENDLVIIEGAGSSAEINLAKDEIVNMRVAEYTQAPVLPAADIDRGGVFASLYGTLELLPPEQKALVKGFIINKFRGNIDLLKPGLEMLAGITDDRPTLGVIPYIRDLLLAQEDSVFIKDHKVFGSGNTEVVVIQLPHISNFDDFDALLLEENLKIRFVDKVSDLGSPDAVILPGTKCTINDLLWLQECGLAEKIIVLAKDGVPLVGICGGFQMLGETIYDDDGIEGKSGKFAGLGLLGVQSRIQAEKTTVQNTAVLYGNPKQLTVEGYEIHMGLTELSAGTAPMLKTASGSFDGAVSDDGKIRGTYFHGIFDRPAFRRLWLESLGWEAAGSAVSLQESRERELESLADTVESSLDMDLLDRIIGIC